MININPNRNGSFKIDIRNQFDDPETAYNYIKEELEKHNIIYIKEINDFYNKDKNRIYNMCPETIKGCIENNYILPFKAKEPLFFSEVAILKALKNEKYNFYKKYNLI